MSNVKVIGADEVSNYLRNIARNKSRVTRSWLRDNAIDSVNTVQRHILNAGAVFTNELIDGMHYELNSSPGKHEAVIRPSDKADEYAWFVEAGTKPHKAPIEALRPWAERHGIPVGAVWHKIATEGTDPRWFARDSFEEIKPSVERDVPRLAERLLKGI